MWVSPTYVSAHIHVCIYIYLMKSQQVASNQEGRRLNASCWGYTEQLLKWEALMSSAVLAPPKCRKVRIPLFLRPSVDRASVFCLLEKDIY